MSGTTTSAYGNAPTFDSIKAIYMVKKEAWETLP